MTTAPLLPAAEAPRAEALRAAGFPVRGHVIFHTASLRGDDLAVATRKAVAAGAFSGVARFVPGPGPKAAGMSAEGHALVAWFRAEGRLVGSPEECARRFPPRAVEAC